MQSPTGLVSRHGQEELPIFYWNVDPKRSRGVHAFRIKVGSDNPILDIDNKILLCLDYDGTMIATHGQMSPEMIELYAAFKTYANKCGHFVAINTAQSADIFFDNVHHADAARCANFISFEKGQEIHKANDQGGMEQVSREKPPKEVVQLGNELREALSGIQDNYTITNKAFGVAICFSEDRSFCSLANQTLITETAKAIAGKYDCMPEPVPGYIDFSFGDSDKGKAIQKILELIPEEVKYVVAFGDGRTDIPAFEKADLPIIVGRGLRVPDELEGRSVRIISPMDCADLIAGFIGDMTTVLKRGHHTPPKEGTPTMHSPGASPATGIDALSISHVTH